MKERSREVAERLSLFKRRIVEKVKFHEVDLLGVCNNAVYFNYFEDARLDYLQNLKSSYALNILTADLFFIMARNECDYISPAKFDDTLHVYTKIDRVKRTSIKFSHLIVNPVSECLIAVGGGILVQINAHDKSKEILSEEFRDAVSDFEKDVEIIGN